MVPGEYFEARHRGTTGDVDYYTSNGDLAYQVRCGQVVWTNPKCFFIMDSCAANAPRPEPKKPEPVKSKEPFYAQFQRKRKTEYLSRK